MFSRREMILSLSSFSGWVCVGVKSGLPLWLFEESSYCSIGACNVNYLYVTHKYLYIRVYVLSIDEKSLIYFNREKIR